MAAKLSDAELVHRCRAGEVEARNELVERFSLREDAALHPWIAQLTRRICLDRAADASREGAVGGDRGNRR